MKSAGYSAQRYTSIWDAVEDTPGAAAHMQLRSELMMAVTEHIRKNALTQVQAARLFGITQPRVSDLIRGKIELFSIDALVQMLAAARTQVQMKLKKAA